MPSPSFPAGTNDGLEIKGIFRAPVVVLKDDYSDAETTMAAPYLRAARSDVDSLEAGDFITAPDGTRYEIETRQDEGSPGADGNIRFTLKLPEEQNP